MQLEGASKRSRSEAVRAASVPRPRRGKPRVALVSDQHLTGEAVSAALSARGHVVLSLDIPSRTGQYPEFRRELAAFRPGVVLLLQELTDPMHLRDALRTVAAVPNVRWVLLTGSPEGPRWGGGIAAGALMVLPMSIGLQELLKALTQVLRGDQVLTPEERERLVRLWEEGNTEEKELLERLDLLTARETEILIELRNGRAVSDIALEAEVSVATVRSQVKSILRKLDVPSQLAAVAVLQRVSNTMPMA